MRRRTLPILLALVCLRAAEPNMALIPAGSFSMGRSKLTADDKTKMRPQILLDDRPVHVVKLPPYLLDTKETTQAEYAEFVNATKRKAPYHWAGGKVPDGTGSTAAYNVSWDDAKSYCEWRGKRLPTEAEWERAARGGLENADYPWGDKYDAKLARHNTETGPGVPGRYPPNAFGLYDMAGNMAEWTADWFAREYYKNSPAENPKGPEIGTYRIIRGGAWSDQGRRITVFFRNWVRPTQKQPNIGIRCAKDAPAAEQRIRERIAGFQGVVSLHAKNLRTGSEFGIGSDERVRTASTIKLPILVAVAQAVADGKANWEEELTLTAADKVSGSGVLSEFTAGQKFLLRDLANLMIVVSDNTATNLILDRITADYVNAVMEKYGFTKTRSNRKILGDGKNLKPQPSGWSAFGQKEENKKFGIGVSTPREMVRLLEMLYKGEIVSAEASKEILATMDRQRYTDGIGRHLAGFRVASKSGGLDALRSDVGLVTGKTAAYAVAITVDGMPKIDYSADNVGNILISDLTAMLLEKLP
ncbi:MAG TPA: serine hydrolase [Bryobacteraceae bacterium]|nr:serine hydrolase [Bryobacteraceae bacterium]